MENGSRIRCEIAQGGGTYHEYFDRSKGWQDRVRAWAKRIGAERGAEFRMFYASNGVTFKLVNTQKI